MVERAGCSKCYCRHGAVSQLPSVVCRYFGLLQCCWKHQTTDLMWPRPASSYLHQIDRLLFLPSVLSMLEFWTRYETSSVGVSTQIVQLCLTFLTTSKSWSLVHSVRQVHTYSINFPLTFPKSDRSRISDNTTWTSVVFRLWYTPERILQRKGRAAAGTGATKKKSCLIPGWKDQGEGNDSCSTLTQAQLISPPSRYEYSRHEEEKPSEFWPSRHVQQKKVIQIFHTTSML